MAQPDASITLLRVKRKRGDEPLDALLLDLPKKKYRDSLSTGVFTFAETVEETSLFADQSQALDLHVRMVHKRFSTTR